MANVVVLLVLAVFAVLVGYVLHRFRDSLIPKRGFGIRADLGALAATPTVKVRAVTAAGPGRVHLVLAPQPDPAGAAGVAVSPDLDLVVLLREDEFGLELLHRWQRSEASVAMVTRPDSRIVRLRSVEDLQPLTLRRADRS